MALELRDTLSGEQRPLVPLEAGHVRIYSCGPTVYGPTHIGNFRSFLFADVLVRYLRYRGLRVTWVMNITDVDDRIITNAAAAGTTIAELSDRWLEQFKTDFAAVRMTAPDVLPRATEHIEAMTSLIQTLLDNGNAYRTDDGSVFFRISSWRAYGRLARLDPEQLKVGERVEADDYGKDDVRDFALWKAAKPGEPSWDTPIGTGRPGWHIECSAMSMQHLGPSFDIHTGGIDLIFPHHEDEIAQSEAATGQRFVGTWLHCDHLRLGGAKMARRVGNIARVADLLSDGVSARALRLALIRVNYRQALEYTEDTLAEAGAAIERLDQVVLALSAYAEDRADDPEVGATLVAAREGFEAALDDDLNVSKALAAVFDLVRDTNRRIAERGFSTADAGRTLELLRDLDRVLGVLPDESEALPEGAGALLEARAAARAARDWAGSDRLRDELADLGVAVEDTRDGQRWRILERVS